MTTQFTESMIPFATLAAALLVALVLRHVLLGLLDRRVTDKLSLPHAFLEAVRLPSILWCFVIAISIAIRTASLSTAQIFWANKSIGAFLIVSISLVIAAMFVRMIAEYGERNHMPFAVAGLSRTLAYVFLLGVAALMLLRLFDIEITPILATLGVGGLAVALALQDTLANFFAGVHILVEEPAVVGDFIRLSSGEEGIVRDIGWRTTRIHTGGNNTIVIPNTKITSGILTNFSMPEKRVVGDVLIFTALDADPDRVGQIVLDVAHSVPGVLAEPAPAVLFDPGVTPTHLGFKLIFHAASQGERGGVESAVRLSVLKRFRQEGIPLPSRERIVVVQPQT